MGDIGIAVNLGLVLALPLLRINASGGLLLSTLDQGLFALALRGSGSCISRHAGFTAYPMTAALGYMGVSAC
jgi:hypothetical protein